MRLVSAKDYPAELLALISQAKQRIIIAAMLVCADDRTAPILDALEAALARGVRVYILGDVYFRVFREGNKRWQQRLTVAETERRLGLLRQKGAQVVLYGRLGLNPFKGRSHLKVTIVDDTVYSFGGVNFVGKAFENADYMLRHADRRLADKLDQLVTNAPHTHEDMTWLIDSQTTLLFDGGQPGVSVIYRTVCELAARAKRIYYVSQMVPSGELAQRILDTEYVAYFNRPQQSSKYVALSLVLDNPFGRLKNRYHRRQYLHAKFMLFELKDGTKTLVSGSHNFSERGVRYGTQEIAIRSTDEKLWEQLYDFLKTSVDSVG
ncbi:MAG TPA: phospholipase D-like domain-containing protein [Candidatus Acidoferrum sp.]|nr:phospholipase D-like domain-containing protein [Candidatus Acidoferrum sp.]